MALRWTAAGLLEAQKTFRRLKAYRQLPILRNGSSAIETIMNENPRPIGIWTSRQTKSPRPIGIWTRR